MAVQNWSFWVLMIGFGLGLGTFYALCTLLNQLLDPFGYTQTDSGTLGSVILFVGLAGAIVAGPLLDKTKSYLLCFLGGILLFTLELRKDNFWILLFCCGFIGFFATAMIPVGLEAGVECTYPVTEEISSGLLLMFGQIFGIIITLVVNTINDRHGSKDAAYWQMGFAALSLLFVLFFKTKYNRLEAEKTPQGQ